MFASGLARGWFFWWRGDAHDDEHPHVVQTRALALPERTDSPGALVVSILLRIDCVSIRMASRGKLRLPLDLRELREATQPAARDAAGEAHHVRQSISIQKC